ncbi:MAG: hypothetical protein WCC94_12720 [Candidatus Bathyarchaeia archaeon]
MSQAKLSWSSFRDKPLNEALHGHVRSYPPFRYHSIQCDVQVVRYWRSTGYDRYTFYHVDTEIEELFHIQKTLGISLAEAVETWKLMNEKVQLLNAS